ncbi:acyltransferase [Leucobacter sp. NPDC058333]|uniref:acyltransferase family protein n=1 Tax=Leucobacter sp. NPDC058333 TaxID=3346450 RepID=UPI00364A1DFB
MTLSPALPAGAALAPQRDPRDTSPRAAPQAPQAPQRDATIDTVRAFALLIVVVLHALMVGAQLAPSGALVTSVALSGEPWFAPLTWVLQVMPLFFIAGGFASLSQWRRMQARGVTATEYVAGRVRRLAVPAALMIGVVGAVLLAARAFGADATLIGEASLRIGQPLWFLAVYFGATALVPALAWLHDRAPIATISALSVGVFAVDIAHSQFGVPIGYLNLLLVWPLMQQLGFAMQVGACAAWSRRRLVTGVRVSLALLLVLLACGWSPDMIENLNPPTTAIMLLGFAQFCALQLLREQLDRVTRIPWVALASTRASASAMGVYLWHMPVMLLFVAIMWATGLPLPAPHSAAWWATRLPWLVVIGVCVIPLAVAVGRLERRVLAQLQAVASVTSSDAPARRVPTLLCVVCAIAGTVAALLFGIAQPVPFACAVALLTVAINLATVRR